MQHLQRPEAAAYQVEPEAVALAPPAYSISVVQLVGTTMGTASLVAELELPRPPPPPGAKMGASLNGLEMEGTIRDSFLRPTEMDSTRENARIGPCLAHGPVCPHSMVRIG